MQVILSSEALSHLNTSSPAVFLTFNFFDFETQVTPVVQGARCALVGGRGRVGEGELGSIGMQEERREEEMESDRAGEWELGERWKEGGK